MNLLTGPNVAGLPGHTEAGYSKVEYNEVEYVEDHEVLDPNDSDKLCDHSRGQTIIHAWPARLEDEGQSGG